MEGENNVCANCSYEGAEDMCPECGGEMVTTKEIDEREAGKELDEEEI